MLFLREIDTFFHTTRLLDGNLNEKWPAKKKVNLQLMFARKYPAYWTKHRGCLIMNHQGHNNIRIGMVWVQRGHSTGTSAATLCVIEL